MDLWFADPTRDLLTIFIDCLVRLPNLRILEIFTPNVSLGASLERECARFPSIRELWVMGSSTSLVRYCPNVESLTVTGLGPQDPGVLHLYGCHLKKLKRVAGISLQYIPGELRETFWPGAPIHRRYRYGSRTDLAGPPGDLHPV